MVAAGAKFDVKCKRGTDKCKIISNGRSCCKKCRLKKCEEIGMEMTNFQFNRDRTCSSQKVTPSMTTFLGRPQFLISCDPETASSSTSRTLIDISEFLDKAKQILNSNLMIPLSPGQNRLRKMSNSLDMERYKDAQESDMKKISSVGLKESMSFWEHDLLAVSKWLSHFDEFQELDLEVKLKFIKSFWHIWNRLEKLGRTALLYKNRKSGNNAPILLADFVFDVPNMELDLKWLTDYSVEQLANYLEGIGDWSMFTPLQPMLDLDPTDIELNYMLAQISFSFAVKELDGIHSELAEKLLKIVADDLHSYYQEERKMRMYSDRISKMMKVNSTLMKVFRERKEKLLILKTFDIFHAEALDHEMFKDLL